MKLLIVALLCSGSLAQARGYYLKIPAGQFACTDKYLDDPYVSSSPELEKIRENELTASIYIEWAMKATCDTKLPFSIAPASVYESSSGNHRISYMVCCTALPKPIKN